MHFNRTNISLSLLFFMSSFTVLFAQINEVDEQGLKQGKWVKTFDDSDDIRYSGQFKDGKPVGKFVYYFPNGVVRSIIKHDDNSDRSEAYFYHPSKDLLAHGIYRGKKKDSIWSHFLTTGHCSYIETYKNGKLHGERITYYGQEAVENPNVRIILRKMNYVNGLAEGPFVEYFPDGKKKMEGQYHNNYLSGEIKRYEANGTLMISERYKNKQKHGWWIAYDESGKETGRIYYYNGNLMEGEQLEKHLKKLKEKGVNPNK